MCCLKQSVVSALLQHEVNARLVGYYGTDLRHPPRSRMVCGVSRSALLVGLAPALQRLYLYLCSVSFSGFIASALICLNTAHHGA